MPMEQQGFYDGRKGQKRLKAIEKQIEKVNAEFDSRYKEVPEMQFLKNEIAWEGTAGLIFVMAQRDVNYKWNGLRDYGFIRACRQWVLDNHVKELTSQAVVTMIKAVLPAKMCTELSEELAALDIF